MASMFTRRHYTAVADTIGLTLRQIDRTRDTDSFKAVSALAIAGFIENLTVTFKEDNGKFNEHRFDTRIELIRDEGLQS